MARRGKLVIILVLKRRAAQHAQEASASANDEAQAPSRRTKRHNGARRGTVQTHQTLITAALGHSVARFVPRTGQHDIPEIRCVSRSHCRSACLAD